MRIRDIKSNSVGKETAERQGDGRYITFLNVKKNIGIGGKTTMGERGKKSQEDYKMEWGERKKGTGKGVSCELRWTFFQEGRRRNREEKEEETARFYQLLDTFTCRRRKNETPSFNIAFTSWEIIVWEINRQEHFYHVHRTTTASCKRFLSIFLSMEDSVFFVRFISENPKHPERGVGEQRFGKRNKTSPNVKLDYLSSLTMNSEGLQKVSFFKKV